MNRAIEAASSRGDAAILAAFRQVTDWTDEDVLHYAACTDCNPDGGDDTWYCEGSPVMKRQREQEAPRRPYSEPVRPQSPLAVALRRMGDEIVADAKARVPLHYGAVRNSATPQALALIREQVGDAREIRRPW